MCHRTKKINGITSLANRAKDKNAGLGANAFNAQKANNDDSANKPAENGWTCTSSYKSSHSAAKTTARKKLRHHGHKHRVDHGVHIVFDAISPQFAKRTGFSDDDAEKIKTVLTKLFEGDASFACPEGNVEVMKLIWLEHNCKAGQYSSTKVHGSLKEDEDGSYEPKNLEDLVSQQIDGL